jgi:hypothetical protein
MAEKLNLLDQFPELTLTTPANDAVHLPFDLKTPYAIVLFYRGHW